MSAQLMALRGTADEALTMEQMGMLDVGDQ